MEEALKVNLKGKRNRIKSPGGKGINNHEENDLFPLARRRMAVRKGMIIFVALVIGFVMGALTVGTSGGAAALSFCTGNKYLTYPYDTQIGYVIGASDVFTLVAASNVSQARAAENAAKYSRCIAHMSPDQIHAIVEKYFKDYPQKQHYAMASILWEAVSKSCPE